MLPLTPSLPILTGTPGGPLSLLPQTPPPPIQFFSGQDPAQLLPMGLGLDTDFNCTTYPAASPSPGVPFGAGVEDDFVVGGGCWPVQFSPPTPDILREINPYYGCSPSPPAIQTTAASTTPPPLQFAPLSTAGTPPEVCTNGDLEALSEEGANKSVTNYGEAGEQGIAIPAPSSSPPVAAPNPIISPPLNLNPFLFQVFCRI